MISQRIRNGSALLLSIIILATLSAWAVFICTVSGSNLQIAENHRKGDGARASAESGLEISRFWLSRISLAGTTNPSAVFGQLAATLQTDLTTNNITNLVPAYDSGSTISIPTVSVDSSEGRSFSAQITQLSQDLVQLDVTGQYGSLTRTIRVNYNVGQSAHNVFDYGVATRGPLSLSGNIALDGVNISVESDVYIESENSLLALSIIGNSQIAGNVSIANPLANVHLQGGQAGIGGETGQDAIDNHVSFGVPPTEFPTPNPAHFAPYVTGVVDSSTDTSADATFENIRIAANTNPTFTGQTTLNGVVYIETPNVVTFAGGTTITGVIVGNGDLEDNSATNQIVFLGNVDSHPVSDLPEEAQFSGIRNEAGTFLMAPGFHLAFGGNFSTLNGAIAGNGIEFFGNAGGTIQGSVINYSDVDMTLSGNSDLLFNRSGTTEIPAGFVPEIIMEYDPSSYSEVMI